MMRKFLIGSVFLILFYTVSFGQTGDVFEIEQAVIASGGEQNASAGGFSLDSTIGQAAAGQVLSGKPFTITSGFWTFTPLVPTAAQVTVGGRVRTSGGRGIRNVYVTISNTKGESRTTFTGMFGHFKFEGITVGETYFISVASKRFVFSQSMQVLFITEDIGDINFIADAN